MHRTPIPVADIECTAGPTTILTNLNIILPDHDGTTALAVAAGAQIHRNECLVHVGGVGVQVSNGASAHLYNCTILSTKSYGVQVEFIPSKEQHIERQCYTGEMRSATLDTCTVRQCKGQCSVRVSGPGNKL